MRPQTLLPAILFAQSSFAYSCCFEVLGQKDVATGVFANGGVFTWAPRTDCIIEINTNAESCPGWRWRYLSGTSCKTLGLPLAYLGTAPRSQCN